MTPKSSTTSSPFRGPSCELRPIDRLLEPLRAFGRHDLAGAGLLLLATVVALGWANSPWASTYHALLHTPVGAEFGDVRLEKTLHHWINDGLMGLFFFLVGLEIKRELLVGELASLRKATLPAVAAVGGMVVPAVLFYALNPEGEASQGWGIPMVTDIAFVLGVLAVLGDRVPLGAKVFLTALAIVDDIGAVVVIAVFYTDDLSMVALMAGMACLALSSGLNLLRTRSAVAYFIVGTLTWLSFLESGVHATIAALLIAFTIPARTRIDGTGFLARMEHLVARLRAVGPPEDRALNTHQQQQLFERMGAAVDHASAPLQRIEHALGGPVTFVVLPLFALANAGVTIHGGIGQSFASPVVVGIVVGLFVGKTVGILGAAGLSVRLGLADLPQGVTWRHLIGVSMLAGIGFTMALFIAMLAFGDARLLEQAKVGVLAASLLAGTAGVVFLRAATDRQRPS